MIDYARCMKIIMSSSFSGLLSIKYEGEEDPYEGIRKAKELITRYL